MSLDSRGMGHVPLEGRELDLRVALAMLGRLLYTKLDSPLAGNGPLCAIEHGVSEVGELRVEVDLDGLACSRAEIECA